MKRILLTLFAAVISVSAFAQFHPGDIGYDRAAESLYKTNKIKTQTKLLVDSVNQLTTAKEISEFTEDGWLIGITYPDDIVFDDNDDSIGVYMDEFTYFPDGRIRIVTSSGYDIYPIETAFLYTKNNQLDSSFIASADARKYAYKYDKKGNIVGCKGFGYVFTYDDSGNLEDGMQLVPMEDIEYTWSADHQLLTEKTTQLDQSTTIIEFTYTPSGQLSSKKVFTDPGSKIPRISFTYTYDATGLLLSSESRGDDGEHLVYRYEYSRY